MLPFVSIIIPTYERPAQLSACLDALACLAYPREKFEVIVVDDGSARPPAEVVARAVEHLDVRLLTQRNAGPGPARNTGAAVARGSILAFTDDDCAPAADWLEKLSENLVVDPGQMTGGRTSNALIENAYSAASQGIVSFVYSYYNSDPKRARFFASNNFALSADSFDRVGGFAEDWPGPASEDREFCDRWLRCGLRMTYCPDAVVFHRHQLTLRSFWRQHFSYGRGAHFFQQLRAQRAGDRLRIEPLSFYWGWVRYPFSSGERRPWTVAALMVLAHVANAAGFFRQRYATWLVPRPQKCRS